MSCMPEVPMREIVCHNCSRRTRQQLSTIEPLMWLQALMSENNIYINYACPVCGELTRSRVEPGDKVIQEAGLAKFPGGISVYIMFLECSKPDCESPVILLAPIKSDVRDIDLMAHIREHWSTHGAVCAKGYPPTCPYKVRIWKQLEPVPLS